MTKKSIIGVYDDEVRIVDAIKKLQEKGIKINDVLSPYPVHNIIEALKLKTRFPYIAFAYGTLGAILIYSLLYWTFVKDYPINIGGKPSHTFSFIVITFVMTINITVALSLLFFFIRQNLGPGKTAHVIDPRITDDRFVIVVEKEGMKEEQVTTVNRIMKENGAVEVRDQDVVQD